MNGDRPIWRPTGIVKPAREREDSERPPGEIAEAHSGRLAYDPASIRAPLAIIRGEWDHLVTDRDAGWLFAALKNSPLKRDVKISRGTHLMHLETSRYALYR